MKSKKTQGLPPDVEFYEDIPLLIHRPRGLLNEAVVNKLIRVIGDLEFSMKEPFNRFADTLEADAVDLNFRYILHVSLYRRLSYSGRPLVKTAILATDKTMIHYAKLHAMLTQGSPIKVRIFQERAVAAKWLGVPLDVLSREKPDHGRSN
jgi:hypothetical protein